MNKIILIFLVFILQTIPFCSALSQPKEDVDISAVHALVQKSQLHKARLMIDALLPKYPQNASLLLESADLYLKMGQKMLALFEFEKARKLRPTGAQIYIALSKLHLENFSAETALSMARQAVFLDPKNAKGQEALILALMANSHYSEANSRMRELVESRIDDPDVLHMASLVYKNNAKLEMAIAFAKQAIKLKPTEKSWLLELAKLYEENKDYNEAREVIEDFLTLEPDSEEGLKDLAWLLEHRLHDYGQAEFIYTRLIKLDPLNSAAQAGLNRLEVKQNDVAAKFKRSLHSFFHQLFMWFSSPLESRQERLY